MSENSKIEWCDHTFNPWEGCTKVSPGCLNCYAEARNNRFTGGANWGKGKPRRRTSDANWKLPLKWHREAANELENFKTAVAAGAYLEAPRRPRVFCASLADWLDDEVPIEWLCDLLTLIGRTLNLDWLLLSKRPKNWEARISQALNWFLAHSFDLDLANSIIKLDPNFSHCRAVLDKSYEERQTYFRENYSGAVLVSNWIRSQTGEGDDIPPANVWIGTTVEDQTRADERIPHLLRIPATVRFLSCEPLLGPIDLDIGSPKWRDANSYHSTIDWVICGGESGPNARPMHPDWGRSLRDQCKAAGVPFLFKQWGEYFYDLANPIATKNPGKFSYCLDRVGKKKAGRLLDGREWNEFPEATS